jgi:hypothetical protein
MLKNVKIAQNLEKMQKSAKIAQKLGKYLK